MHFLKFDFFYKVLSMDIKTIIELFGGQTKLAEALGVR